MHVGAQIWQLATVIRINLLYSQKAPIMAGPGFTLYRMRVSNTFTVNVIFCPLKANTRGLKNKSCNRNEPRQYTNTWCQTQRRNTQITAEIMQTYDLLKFALARSKNGSSFLLITQYEMPFINKSEATKRSKDRKLCIRQMYKWHEQ